MTTNNPVPSVRTSDIVRKRIRYLRGIGDLSWRQIAQIPDFYGIPAGTLCSIANGADVPKKHRKQLGLPELAPAPVCPVHGVVHVSDCPKVKRANLNRPLQKMTQRELLLALIYRS